MRLHRACAKISQILACSQAGVDSGMIEQRPYPVRINDAGVRLEQSADHSEGWCSSLPHWLREDPVM